jgi:hypothetical protein
MDVEHGCVRENTEEWMGGDVCVCLLQVLVLGRDANDANPSAYPLQHLMTMSRSIAQQ